MSDRLCLIVDDEPAMRSYISAIMSSEHFKTLEAGSAAEAVKIVQRPKGQLALIVSEVEMPGDMNGLELAHSVHNSFPTVPIVLFSGHEKPNNGDICFEFIEKPFTPNTILSVIRRVMAQSE